MAATAWRAGLLKGVHELRFAFCQTSEASEGVRKFITTHYKALKAANPELPVLLRECAGTEARLTARFDKGREVGQSLTGLSADAVAARLDALVKQAA